MPSVRVPLKGDVGWNILMAQRRSFWTKGTNNILSPNFRGHEFFCNDGSACPILARPAMVSLCHRFLEPMRLEFGTCYILSGYRHVLYNASIGGARQSQHIYEMNFESVAADVRFGRGTPLQWGAKARELRTKRNNGDGGIGVYPPSGFVHLDNRGYKADW